MDKAAKTSDKVSKKKGAGGVSTAAYGAVASATGSGGAPTSFKCSNKSRRPPKLKTQSRWETKDIAATTDLSTKFNLKPLIEGEEKIGIKEMEYEETSITHMKPMEKIALPIHPGETATVASIDVDGEEDDPPPLEATPLDTISNKPLMLRKRKEKVKTPSQRAGTEISPFKRIRMSVVEPPIPPSTTQTVPYSTDLLEDPLLKQGASEIKDMYKDIAADTASKEQVEKQLVESSKKRQVLSSELEGIEQKELKNANILAQLEGQGSWSDGTTQGEGETKHQAAEAMDNNQVETEHLGHDLEASKVAGAGDMSVLERENGSQQTKIRETSVAEKTSHLEAAEVKTKHLERPLTNRDKEEERKLHDALHKAAREMEGLKTQLEQQKNKEIQFWEQVMIHTQTLRENFKREKEAHRKELEEIKEAKIAATRIADELKKELDRLKSNAEKENQILRMISGTTMTQQEGPEEQGDTAMVLYNTASAGDTSLNLGMSPYQNMMSEVGEVMSKMESNIISQNQMLVDDVELYIGQFKETILSHGQELATQQDTLLNARVKQFGVLINESINKSNEIQEDMENTIKDIHSRTQKTQADISTIADTVKWLGDHSVEDMDHDGPTDTIKIKLAWNLIKQSLIELIKTAHTEIVNLIEAAQSSSAIHNLKHVNEAAARARSLLLENKKLDAVLEQLNIAIPTVINSYDLVTINPSANSVGNDSEDDIKTIKTKMSIASAAYTEIKTILSDVRVIAVEFANTKRQSLQEIETTKIVDTLENSTASRLYYELVRFYFFANAIKDGKSLVEAMQQNHPLLNVFNDAMRFMISRKDNREIMDFLKKTGYDITDDMAKSIDYFVSSLNIELTDDSAQERRDKDKSVFITTMIGVLATVSGVIKINNSIEEDKKQKEIAANQRESRSYLVNELQNQINLKGLRNEIRQLLDKVKESEEKHFHDLINKFDEQHTAIVNIIEAQQRQLQESLQSQKEQQLQENSKRELHELEQQTTDMLQQQQRQQQQQYQTALPPPSSSFTTPVVDNGEGASGERRDDGMDVTETGLPREDETARLTRGVKEGLTTLVTWAFEAPNLNNIEEATKSSAGGGDRNIKMYLKPKDLDENFVEVTLSSTDSGPRNIDTKNLKQALPDKINQVSPSAPPKSEAASKNNTLTDKIFVDTLRDKVFPYSSKSALEVEGEEGDPAALHHPEYFRNSFSKHFIHDSTYFTEPSTFAEKSESVRNFTRLLEYSLFNNTARGARSDNDMLSKLIYVVFEHDAKMIKYLSDITYKFRKYASQSSSIYLYKDRDNLLEATIATVFSAALPVVSSMAPRIAEAMSKPVHDDVRIRSTYSLLSLIEKFIYCASKRVHVLKNVLEKSGLVYRLSLYPAVANAESSTSFDVQYDYSLLRMLLELMAINITNLIDAGITPLKTVVLSIGTFTGADKTARTFIPIDEDRSVLSKANENDIDVPKTIAVVNCLSAVTIWYIANKLIDDKKILEKAVRLMRTLLEDDFKELAKMLNEKSMNKASIVECVSQNIVPQLNTKIEEIVKNTKSNDAILIKGASEVGNLGKTVVNVSLGVSRERLALPWFEVDFRGGIDDSTLLWVLSGSVNSDEVVRDYQLAVPLYSYSSIRRPAAPLHVKPLIRIINNTTGSDNVFLTTNNNKKTPGKEEGGDGGRVHVVNLSNNVSCVLEYSTKDRYEDIINKMYRDGLVLVKGDVEVPRVFPTLDGKWMDNSKDNETFTPLSVSRWKIPSASLVYGMLSNKKTKEEQNQEDEEKNANTSSPSVIDFMGGRAGDVLLKMLTLSSEQPIVTNTDSSSFDASSTNKGLWKTNKDGYTSIDAQSMMARLISDDKRPINNIRTAAAASSPSSMAMVPYSEAANVVVNDPLEVYNSNNSWWIRGIQPSMRRDAAVLSAVQEHIYFVETPIF